MELSTQVSTSHSKHVTEGKKVHQYNALQVLRNSIISITSCLSLTSGSKVKFIFALINASAKLTAVIASYLSKAQYSRMLQPVHKYMVSSALMPDLIQVWLNLYSNGGTSCTYTDKNKHTHYLIIPEVRMYSANSQLGLGSASAHVANI